MAITAAAAVALPALLVAGTQSSNDLPPPEDTEIWEPEPQVISPGIPSAMPTDAIVLFDGNDLSNGRVGTVLQNGLLRMTPLR